MGKKSTEPEAIPDEDQGSSEAPTDSGPVDDGPKFQDGMRSPMDDPAHPLHHLRNA